MPPAELARTSDLFFCVFLCAEKNLKTKQLVDASVPPAELARTSDLLQPLPVCSLSLARARERDAGASHNRESGKRGERADASASPETPQAAALALQVYAAFSV